MVTSVGRATLYWLAIVLSFAAGTVRADEMRLYAKHGLAYDDVKMDLEHAIEGKGLIIGAVGDLRDMLARTGNAIGFEKPVYLHAHYMQFCSALLAHKLAAADASSLGHCPFLMFIYESQAKPGEIVVGYRPIIRSGSEALRRVLDEVDALFDAIAREAVN